MHIHTRTHQPVGLRLLQQLPRWPTSSFIIRAAGAGVAALAVRPLALLWTRACAPPASLALGPRCCTAALRDAHQQPVAVAIPALEDHRVACGGSRGGGVTRSAPGRWQSCQLIGFLPIGGQGAASPSQTVQGKHAESVGPAETAWASRQLRGRRGCRDPPTSTPCCFVNCCQPLVRRRCFWPLQATPS